MRPLALEGGRFYVTVEKTPQVVWITIKDNVARGDSEMKLRLRASEALTLARLIEAETTRTERQ